ncbi:MAG: response regulator [Candidatus Omnitrophota bacterium]
MAGETILVVDDVKIECVALKKELREAGYECESALSGKEAVEKCKHKKYDLVYVDMYMPDIDGIQTCKAIKKVIPSAIVVFMTGKVDKDTIYKEIDFMEKGGKVYYLYKPFNEGEILEVTKKALAGCEKSC